MEKHVIDHQGQPVGIAIPDAGRLKFIAVKFHVMDLDQKLFDSVGEIKKAIRKNVTSHAMQSDAIEETQFAGFNRLRAKGSAAEQSCNV